MTEAKVVPFAWRDRPALIEVAFPAQKVSIEAQSERKANAGQTLTALGSYWKGRKPLILVRACILASLLPATDDPEADLEIFELLMAMDDDAFVHRMKKVTPEDVHKWGGALQSRLLDEDGNWLVKGDERRQLLGRVLAQMPYDERLERRSLRPEELHENAYDAIWERVNAHLGTTARSHVDLVKELGLLRFGHTPRVVDTFCGGGSIPFEAARIGCDVHASDLNPVACMLTWGAIHIVGARAADREAIEQAQERVVRAAESEIARLGVDHDEVGNRAKAYLYCLEARCPETGWMIPMSNSWVVSRNRKTIARLLPDPQNRRFEIEILGDASHEQIEEATKGTVRDGELIYVLEGVEHRVPIRTLRGDRRGTGHTQNDLRHWERLDIAPRPDDIFQERLYCVQWQQGESRDVFFRGVSQTDLARERRVEGIVQESLTHWMEAGLVPDMRILADASTTRRRGTEDRRHDLVRERGWTYWHHLFPPRHLLYWAILMREARAQLDDERLAAFLVIASNALDRSSKLGQWRVGFTGRKGVAPSSDRVEHVFYNNALNVFYNYGARLLSALAPVIKTMPRSAPIGGRAKVETSPAAVANAAGDILITDPPYADAVRYEEISEYFIAWMRKNPPAPFREWVWDTRRDLAVKGSGEDFRREMVKAYTALTNHMPDNGMQIVMFTHQDSKVWGDMAGIFWGAGLRVTAAWYIATETTSELKKGGYVQGTVIMVLRKRTETKKAYKDELVLEIRDEVAQQIETMVGLNQSSRQRGRTENLFEDSDLQMAGYAAALRVLTAYTQIDGTDMTREALRPRVEGERTVINELIEFAVAAANEQLVPDGMDKAVWERLVGAERFYLRMLDLEAAGLKKLDNYQNFAKAFRVADWQSLLAVARPNDARLKSAAEFRQTDFGDSEFGASLLRAVVYAVFEIETEIETDELMSHLRDNVKGYFLRRPDVVAVATYLATKLERVRSNEAAAARVLRDLVKSERLG